MPLTKADFDNASVAWGKTVQARIDAETVAQAALDALEKARSVEAQALDTLQQTLAQLPPGTL